MEVVNTNDLLFFCNELRQTFVDPPEFETIREIKYLMSCIHQNYEVKKDTLGRSLEEMTQELRDLENMQAGNGSTDYEDKKQACLKESESLRRQIVQLEREQEQTELALEDSKSKLEQLEHIHEAKETETLDKSPPFREFLDLYLNISSIKWNYDALPCASGTIYLPSDIKEFSFDQNKSQFEITNEIWALLED